MGRITWQEARELIDRHTAEVSSGELCSTPLVSVRMITYNHEKFIAQAIESVMSQRTSFPFELVIGDDCSTDRTTEIAFEYQKKYPRQIRVLTASENLGQYARSGRLNALRSFWRCRGKYLATLDGDDYWCSPDKLQRQADLLDSDESLSACIHLARVVDGDEKMIEVVPEAPHKDRYAVIDTLDHRRMFAATGSLMFRYDGGELLPPWVLHTYAIDRFVYSTAAARGDIGLIGEEWSVYRRHHGGVSQNQSTYSQLLFRILFFRNIDKIVGRTPETEDSRGAQLGYFYAKLLSNCITTRRVAATVRHLFGALGVLVTSDLSLRARRSYLRGIFERVARRTKRRGHASSVAA